jgi:hypothetical protein
MPEQWFYIKNGQRLGPISSPALKQLAVTGQLQPDDLVWKLGMKDWLPAGKNRRGAWAGTAPPVPATSVPSSVVPGPPPRLVLSSAVSSPHMDMYPDIPEAAGDVWGDIPEAAEDMWGAIPEASGYMHAGVPRIGENIYAGIPQSTQATNSDVLRGPLFVNARVARPLSSKSELVPFLKTAGLAVVCVAGGIIYVLGMAIYGAVRLLLSRRATSDPSKSALIPLPTPEYPFDLPQGAEDSPEQTMPEWDGCGPCTNCGTVINMEFENAVCPICGHRMTQEDAFQVCGDYDGELPDDVYSEEDL